MFLEQIIEKKKIYLEKRKKVHPLSLFGKKPSAFPGEWFVNGLKAEGISVIAEIKKASPSKGVFREDFDPHRLLEQYEQGGARAASVLTEADYFLGSPALFVQLRHRTGLPLLRKDFIIEEYQVYESANMGANAFLLIARLLDAKTLKDFVGLGRELAMEPLVEVHDERELEAALAAGAGSIGVNSRDLGTFETDLGKMKSVLGRIPASCLRVAESGIKDRKDILELREAGADAFLVGETLIRSNDPAGILKSWIK